tara:strand:+ start:1068 stop:1391 length:324 start_codon:yes stop_codon:yes gene_type:complete
MTIGSGWTKITHGRNKPTDEEAAYVAQGQDWNPSISGVGRPSPIYQDSSENMSISDEDYSSESQDFQNSSTTDPEVDPVQQERINRVAMIKDSAGHTANNPSSVYSV